MADRLNQAARAGPRGSMRAWVLLSLAVFLVHGCVIDGVADHVADWSADAVTSPRLKVAYVRALSPTEPLPVPADRAHQPAEGRQLRPPTRAQRPRTVPNAVAPIAAAAASAASDGEHDVEAATAAATPAPVFAAAEAAVPAASAPAEVEPASSAAPSPMQGATSVLAESPGASHAVDAASAASFAWPGSTRVSYRLTGQYRGEVHGSAQVEWVLAAPRYQVNLDVTVGLSMAPLYSRQMRSDGILTADGLKPQRYEEVSKMAFRDRRRVSVRLDDDAVLLADGQRWNRPPAPPTGALAGLETNVQDSASQFVQLTYLFSVQPQRLTPGSRVGFPLALPRRVEPWVYEVIEAETLYTPFGPLETFHVRPRRETPRGNDLLAEAWFSPRLAYLPVRIRIEQDADTFIDLMIESRPELAAPMK